MKARVNLTIEKEIRDRAHAAGINISGVAAIAVSRIVEMSEKETRVNAAKQSPRAVSSEGATS